MKTPLKIESITWNVSDMLLLCVDVSRGEVDIACLASTSEVNIAASGIDGLIAALKEAKSMLEDDNE